MTVRDPRQPIEFEPVALGRRRRVDPAALALVAVVIGLSLAIIKPWDLATPAGGLVAVVPSSAPASSRPEPSAISTRGALVPPTWSDVRPVISRQPTWGIRSIALGSATEASSGAPQRYSEGWVAADVTSSWHATAVLDGRLGAIVALGVTFPPAETPLAVRIWLDHGGGEFEWIDARSIDQVPARGAYLFLRRSVAGAAVRSWGPGQYRVEVLVGGGIRRIDVEIRDRSGVVPDPLPWPNEVPRVEALPVDDLDMNALARLPVGLFAEVDGGVVPLASAAGPVLGEIGAWLDVDGGAAGQGLGSFVARTYQPHASRLGAVLPPSSRVRSASLRRLAPFDYTTDVGDVTTIRSASEASFVAFEPVRGAAWHPGVYALWVVWVDRDGRHDKTWHVELRPGPLPAEPVLLSATRAWAHYAGSSGVLLGTTESIDGVSDASDFRLLEIVPRTGTANPGLGGSGLLGCGETSIHGRPTVIGFLGPVGTELAPVQSRILYPFADAGPLEVLTVADAVPGLTLVAPFLTAEFGGPASYGFRAGTSVDAPGYTICIGLVPPAG